LARPSPATAQENFKGEELVVVNYGGTFGKFWTQYIIEPFEKRYNARVSQVQSLTFDTLAKLRAQRDSPQIDVWLMADQGAVIALNDGLVEPITAEKVPNLTQLVPRARVPGDPYAEFLFVSVGIAYNTDKIKKPPTSWEDLWNPAYKGHVVLPDINACCGHLLMLKMAAMNGGGIDNVDPGFKKLATLKPNVLTFWTSHDQMASLLNNGDAWIGVWASDRAGTQVLQGAPVGVVYPAEGTVLFGNAIGVVKGSKHKALAEKYVNFALDAAQQVNFHAQAVLTPTNKNVKLPDNVQRLMPSGKALENSFTPDWDKVAKYTAAWTERWQREITSK
jgi:putative spermidine/putrescine transport system substrate-binding protein